MRVSPRNVLLAVTSAVVIYTLASHNKLHQGAATESTAADVMPDGVAIRSGSELPARAVPTFPVKEQMADWHERQTIMEEKIGDLERENVWLKRLRGENTDALKSKTAEINVLKMEVAAAKAASVSAAKPAVPAVPAALAGGGTDDHGEGKVSPRAKRVAPQKYITFYRNFGRLNNQLITVATAFEAAKFLNWTVYMRSEDRLFDSKCRGCENVLVGVEDGLWDTDHMREHFDMLLEPEVVAEHGSVAQHPVLGKSLGNKACSLPGWPAPMPTTDKLLDFAKRCDVIDIGGKNGPTWIDGLKFELGFFHAFRPAPYIREAADHFLSTIDWGTASGMPALAVHSRIFWENRHCKYGHAFCQMKVRQQLNKDGKLIKDKAKVAAVAEQMCYPTPKNLNLVLDMSEVADHEITKDCGMGKGCKPWLLTSDSESGGNLEALDRGYNAKIFDINQYRVDKHGGKPMVNRTRPYAEGSRGHIIRNLEASFADLYLLSRGDFFAGNVYSTFTATVCKVRGADAVGQSNTCRTLTDRGNDVFFVNAEKRGLPEGWTQHWEQPEARKGYERICQREFQADKDGITLHF